MLAHHKVWDSPIYDVHGLCPKVAGWLNCSFPTARWLCYVWWPSTVEQISCLKILCNLLPQPYIPQFSIVARAKKNHKIQRLDWITNWNGLFERIYGWTHSARSTSTHGFASSSRSAATRNKWPGLECMVPRPGSLLNWWVRQRKFNVFIGLHAFYCSPIILKTEHSCHPWAWTIRCANVRSIEITNP